MLNDQALFLNPICSSLAPIGSDEIAKLTGKLKEVSDAFRAGAGEIVTKTDGVDLARFGWDDIRRVLYASSCDRSDDYAYFVQAYVSLRDGRFATFTGDYLMRRDVFLPQTAHVEFWAQSDWDAFRARLLQELPDPDDPAHRAHIDACATFIEFLHQLP